jgi:Acylphosphatases
VAETIRFHAVVTGRVQGIGYRWFVRDAASRLGLNGWVRNTYDGGVELEAEAPSKETAEIFIEELRRGHTRARVKDIAVDWGGSGEESYKDFEIR